MTMSTSARTALTRRAAMRLAVIGAGAALLLGQTAAVQAATSVEVETSARAQLAALYIKTPKAKIIGNAAKAILIFPKIIKAGFMVGAQRGDGLLLIDGKPSGDYSISAASFGFQAGVQSFSYIMFLMTDKAVARIQDGTRWDIGAGPSVVTVDEGVAKTINTLTLKKDVYAFHSHKRD